MVKFILKSEAKFPEKLWNDAQNGKFTDCSIKIENEIFRAHRVILSSRSEYLENFFSRSKSKISFQISNVTSQSIANVIKLIYCNEVDVEAKRAKVVATLIAALGIDAGITEEHDSESEESEESIVDGLRGQSNASFEGIFNSTEVIDVDNEPSSSSFSNGSLTDVNLDDSLPSIAPIVAPRRFTKRNRYWMRSIRRSSGLLSESCRYCPSQRFVSSRGRAFHEITCPFNEDSREFYKCDKCGKLYLLKANLSRHLRNKHINTH